MASRLYAASLRPLISHGASSVCHRITALGKGPLPEVEVPYHLHCPGDGLTPGVYLHG